MPHNGGTTAAGLRFPGNVGGQDTPDTYRGEFGSLTRVPSNYHDPDYISRLNETDSVVPHSSSRPPNVNHVREINTVPRPQHAKYPDYSQSGKRIASYNNWPPTAKQNPQNLSEAGFFYTGQADSVRCFICGTGLRNWDPEDEPWVEHARWAPECSFVRDKKGQDFINLVQVAVRQQQMQEALQQQSESMTREATDIAADCVPPTVHTDVQSNASSSPSMLPVRKPPTTAEKKNPLLTDAAQSVLAMGYLPRIVKVAVDKVLASKGWDGMSGSNIANVIFDMEESGEIDKDNCMVPKILSDSSWKKINDRLPGGNLQCRSRVFRNASWKIHFGKWPVSHRGHGVARYMCISNTHEVRLIRKSRKSLKTEGKTYPFAKEGGLVDVLTSVIKAEVSKSVGLLYVDEKPKGTGFRVGDKYVITCQHVIKDIIKQGDSIDNTGIFIEFGRKEALQAVDDDKIFHFTSTLHYTHDGYDVAILELRNKIEYPPPLTKFSKMHSPCKVHLIGHPGGRQMKEDSEVWASFIEPNKHHERIKDLQKWSKKNLCGIDYYSVLRDLPRKVLFDTTFGPGSSGSPGIMEKNGKPSVVLIVRGGVPECYFEHGVQVQAKNRVEYGYAMEDICGEMKKSPDRNVKSLAEHIFGDLYVNI